MTHIVVELEDDANASMVLHAIRMIKGVKHATVKREESKCL